MSNVSKSSRCGLKCDPCVCSEEERKEITGLMNGEAPSGVVIERKPMRTVRLNMPDVYIPSGKKEAEPLLQFNMTPKELFSIGDFSEISQAVITMPGDFLDTLTETQIGELVKAIPDKFLREECHERGIEVNPFERED